MVCHAKYYHCYKNAVGWITTDDSGLNQCVRTDAVLVDEFDCTGTVTSTSETSENISSLLDSMSRTSVYGMGMLLFLLTVLVMLQMKK